MIEDELFKNYRCPACKKIINTSHVLCDECLLELHAFKSYCVKCSYPLEENQYECPRCAGKRIEHADRIFVTYSYDNAIRKLILAIKFNYLFRAAKRFNSIILPPPMNISTYDAIIPVPSHPLRKLRRFYHPTDIIAKHISREFNIDIDYSLKRIRYTNFQSKVDRNHRKQNIYNAFRYDSDIKYKNVLLIDDILTTGNTINECCRVLKSNDIKRIDVYVLTKT